MYNLRKEETIWKYLLVLNISKLSIPDNFGGVTSKAGEIISATTIKEDQL